MRTLQQLGLLCVLHVLSMTWVFAASIQFQVRIDTTPLAGDSGFLAFDLLGGSPLHGSLIRVSAFSTTGTLGTPSAAGSVTGTLSDPPLSLTASAFFSEYLQPIAFGSGRTTFSLLVNPVFTAGATPDSFALFLLDDSLSPFPTSDPTGANALFAIDLRDVLAPEAFTSSSASASFIIVPEPNTVLFAVVAFAFFTMKIG